MNKLVLNLLFLILTISIPPSIEAFPSKTSTTSEQSLLGQVGIKDYKIEDIIIGVLPYEREQTQDLHVDITVTYDLQHVLLQKEQTLDYVLLADLAKKEATEGKYFFIDVLGIEILKKLFDTFPNVTEAFIRIKKPAALPNSISGGLVEISMSREELKNFSKVMGNIGFDGLFISNLHGKDVFVDVRAKIDLRCIEESNDLNSTVSYVELARIFEEMAHQLKDKDFETIEAAYLKRLYQTYSNIEEAFISVRGRQSNDAPNDAIVELRMVKG